MELKTGKKISLKIFSRNETGTVKKNGFIMSRGTFIPFAKLNFL
jgi:hypothetical protein